MQTPAEAALEALAPLLITDEIEASTRAILEAITLPFDGLAEIADSDEHGGLGILLDVDATPDPVWLGQFVGVNGIDGLLEEDQRSAVRSRNRWQRGTDEGVIGAVELTLTGDKFVYFRSRYQGDPYRDLLITHTSETTDADKTFAAARRFLPMGHVLTHTVTDGMTYAEAEATYALYSDAETAFATYLDAETA